MTCGRARLAPWRGGVAGRSVLSGPGSDLTEEPASRDVEPVTLAEESFPFVLPGPSAPAASRVGNELAVDGVAHVTFERAERFLVGLAFAYTTVEVGASFGVRLAELTDRDHVDRVVEFAVPALGEPMHRSAG